MESPSERETFWGNFNALIGFEDDETWIVLGVLNAKLGDREIEW